MLTLLFPLQGPPQHDFFARQPTVVLSSTHKRFLENRDGIFGLSLSEIVSLSWDFAGLCAGCAEVYCWQCSWHYAIISRLAQHQKWPSALYADAPGAGSREVLQKWKYLQVKIDGSGIPPQMALSFCFWQWVKKQACGQQFCELGGFAGQPTCNTVVLMPAMHLAVSLCDRFTAYFIKSVVTWPQTWRWSTCPAVLFLLVEHSIVKLAVA